jgi:GST-like protein
MIKLFGMGSPNVAKVLIMLEEVALPYNFTRVDVIGGEQFGDKFKAMNPNSKVPVLVDESAPSGPTTIFESGAILLYLAEKAGAFMPVDFGARYEVLQWLMFQMASLGPIGGQAIHFSFATKQDSYARARFTNELNRLMEVLDKRLEERNWVAGNDYSVADIAIFPWIRTMIDFLPTAVDRSNIQRWYNDINSRPAVRKANEFASSLSKQDRAAMREAPAEKLDRYFGRTMRNQVHD